VIDETEWANSPIVDQAVDYAELEEDFHALEARFEEQAIVIRALRDYQQRPNKARWFKVLHALDALTPPTQQGEQKP
jgi:hypothetical protein